MNEFYRLIGLFKGQAVADRRLWFLSAASERRPPGTLSFRTLSDFDRPPELPLPIRITPPVTGWDMARAHSGVPRRTSECDSRLRSWNSRPSSPMTIIVERTYAGPVGRVGSGARAAEAGEATFWQVGVSISGVNAGINVRSPRGPYSMGPVSRFESGCWECAERSTGSVRSIFSATWTSSCSVSTGAGRKPSFSPRSALRDRRGPLPPPLVDGGAIRMGRGIPTRRRSMPA